MLLQESSECSILPRCSSQKPGKMSLKLIKSANLFLEKSGNPIAHLPDFDEVF